MNKFNNVFVNVGPNLAEQIPVPQTLESKYNNLVETSSIFLTAVD